MVYVIQTNAGQIITDVGRQIVDASGLSEFLGRSPILYRFQEDESKIVDSEIPVGTIEWTTAVSGHNLFPTNLPQSLCCKPYASRSIIRTDRGGLEQAIQTLSEGRTRRVFLKSDSMVKGIEPMLVYSAKDAPQDTAYFLSEEIDILAEWRAFIFRGVILDVRRYAGPWTENLDPEYCRALCSMAKNPALPSACTIDIAKTPSGYEWLEIHNFLCCGLYGYDDPLIIARMTDVAWKEELNSN